MQQWSKSTLKYTSHSQRASSVSTTYEKEIAVCVGGISTLFGKKKDKQFAKSSLFLIQYHGLNCTLPKDNVEP